MKSFEKIFFTFVIGSVFPIFLCLSSFVIWFYFDRSENRIPIYLVSGFLISLIIDLIFLKDWINNRFELPLKFVAAIYIFYNIVVYGVFMGFPVFNVLLGLVAGYYYGNKINNNNIQPNKPIRQVTLFTVLVMSFFCVSSAFIALSGNGVGKDIQGMLRLNFTVSNSMLWAMTIIGGILLILINIKLTKFALIKTLKQTR
jgi:hypothetical protein